MLVDATKPDCIPELLLRDTSPAVVLGGDERHRRDNGRPHALADLHSKRRVLLMMAILDVTHRNVLAQRRRRNTARHDANLLRALRIKDLGTLYSAWSASLKTARKA